MKKLTALFLILSLILCGCAGKPAETTTPGTEGVTEAPTTAPATEVPTEVPTDAVTEVPTEAPAEAPTEPPVFRNPLNGEILEAPMEGRAFAVTINNVQAAMPMYGVSKADLFFEMFVNDYCTRGLALFSDIRQVSAVGSVRSMRYNFTDLCQIYDAVAAYASGSSQVLSDVAASGIDHISVESEGSGYYFRDESRRNAGYAWEHTLFVKGPEIREYARQKGIRMESRKETYGLNFTEDGTPAGGETANEITIRLKHDGVTKKTFMRYDAEQGAYLFHQFDQVMYDGAEKQNIYFENVIVIFCAVHNESVYHVAELTGSGEGFFACGGKIIPIRWSRERAEDPISFTLADGTPLLLGVGSSYIAIAPLTSYIEYK